MSFARVRALVVVGVLAVAAIVFVIVALVRDTQRNAADGETCPAGAPMADVQLPDDPDQVTVKILNGTKTPGLAESVTNDFKNRRFKVQAPAQDKKQVKDVAVVRYGPAGVGSAQLIEAYFLGQATPEYDAKRKGAVVEISIGQRYQQLATSTEVNQSLVELGEPQVPEGACAAPAKKS